MADRNDRKWLEMAGNCDNNDDYNDNGADDDDDDEIYSMAN